MADYVVMVTGGNGLLGQHVIKHLHLYADWITEIRVLDIQPYIRKLDFVEKKPVKVFKGSIIDLKVVREACQGCSAVLHLASLIDTRFQPDVELLNLVNVKGTNTVLQACIEENIQHFVYCSSISVVQGHEDVCNGTEVTLKSCKRHLFKDYGKSKSKAEASVLQANGTQLSNGLKMQTLSLIPVTMFGELDDNLVPKALKAAAMNKGTLIRLGKGDKKEQYAYVGNVAYGFICALDSLRKNPDLGSERFFMTDDYPPGSVQVMLAKFLKLHGHKLSKWYIPSWVMYFIVTIIQIICLLLNPFKRISFLPSRNAIKFLRKDFYVSYGKAHTMLNYSPLYSPNEAIEMSSNYYKTWK